MSQLRVTTFAVSLDGFAAGPAQDIDNPLGVGGGQLHGWALETRTFRKMFGLDGGSVGIDDQFVVRGFTGFGATIMGRNMFGPVRGPWSTWDDAHNDEWTGWWGDEPPYHHPVFVLTQYARPSLEMAGGTTFHFVTDGIEAALGRARQAAGDLDIKVAGGAATIRQFLAAGLIDDLQFDIAPVLLGGGERLFDNLGDLAADYEITEFVGTDIALHVSCHRRTSPPRP